MLTLVRQIDIRNNATNLIHCIMSSQQIITNSTPLNQKHPLDKTGLFPFNITSQTWSL